jgi:hypothetical protein
MAQDPYVQLRQYRNDLNLKEYWATAPPSAITDQGPYSVGDVMWNSAPASAAPIGWVCTVAGADGTTSTWKGFGVIL